MRSTIVLILCFALGCNSQPAERIDSPSGTNRTTANDKDPREELPTAIATALRQLENQEYEKFVADFVTPAEKHKLAGLKIAEISTVLEPLSDDLISQLLRAQLVQPTLEDDGRIARFINVNSDGRDLVFEKSGKYWYIQGAAAQ